MTASLPRHSPSAERYAAVDVETTGINPERDVIIEVGIVVFGREGVIERYSQLVNPKRPVPRDIQTLTGIDEEDLGRSPTIDAVIPEIRRLIGHLPIVGHNIDFDVSMLRGAGIEVTNRQFDTYTLATLVLPNIPNYTLSQVAISLGVEVDVVHRGLPDAQRAADVFTRLLDRVDAYDERTLNQAARLAQQAGWPEAHIFRMAADRQLSGPIFGISEQGRELTPELRFMEPRERPEVLSKTGSADDVDPDAIAFLLSDAGPLPQVLQRYESRPLQITMAEAVARVLNSEGELLVEAGTGTGKSLAYLLPSAMFAIERGERVVITTDTLALQDQLYQKDLPDVRTALHEAGITEDLRVSVMKGRANYLCLSRWFEHMDDPIESPADASLRAKILLWVGSTQTGDKAELRITREEDVHWRRFASERGRCSAKRCAFARVNQCFLYRARHMAANAHIVIANHSLMLSNSSQGYVLPPFDRLVIDEAHHLEEEATSQFSWSVNRNAIEDPVRALIHPEGVIQGGAFATTATFLGRSRDTNAIKAANDAQERAGASVQRSAAISALAGELMTRLGSLLPPPRGNRQSWSDQLRLTEAIRQRGFWGEVSLVWSQLDAELLRVLEDGRWFLKTLDSLNLPDDDDHPESAYRDELTLEMQNSLEEVTTVRLQLLSAFEQDDGTRVFWVERSPQQAIVSLGGAPLDVSGLLRAEVFDQVRTTVLTSATLTIDGSFDYIVDRLGLESAICLPLGSPFDHERSTLVYLADDMPEPNSQNYQSAVNSTLIDLLTATGGRALVLFTSHGALQATHKAIKGPLERHNISVLGQHIDGSFRQLVERLRANTGTVLLGTSSFWEGVDVVGSALSLVVIVKLPFPVPSDPVFEARSEMSPDPFNELSVPQAVLKFKQGFGRLIRSSSDRGVCVVLDRRIVTRRYGQSFIHSLPSTRVVVGSTYDLPVSAENWLALSAVHGD